MTLPLSMRVDDTSRVGEVRRLSGALCRELGFDETRAAEATLVVTELATNLVKHTGGAGGTVVFRPIRDGSGDGLDIVSLDKGRGIANIGDCLRDGFSTTGSLGTGLGAVRRLSAEFDLYSVPGQGTAVFCRLLPASPAVPPPLAVGAVCLPVQGESVCGDAWSMSSWNGTSVFLLTDGLGHGPDAGAASDLAVTIFQKHSSHGPAELVELIHMALKSTRGAVVAVAELSLRERVVRFAGVGNILGRIASGSDCRSLVSYNGTAGVEVRKIRQFSYPWPGDGVLVMHSDGVATHWDLQDYPGLMRKHPALIAGVLYRDHVRPKDDSTVLVVKEAQGAW